jgi:hypothetical protein
MTDPSRPARIWYQSFVHPEEQAPYIERLQAYLDKVAAPNARYEVHGLDRPTATSTRSPSFAAPRR